MGARAAILSVAFVALSCGIWALQPVQDVKYLPPFVAFGLMIGTGWILARLIIRAQASGRLTFRLRRAPILGALALNLAFPYGYVIWSPVFMAFNVTNLLIVSDWPWYMPFELAVQYGLACVLIAATPQLWRRVLLFAGAQAMGFVWVAAIYGVGRFG